MKALIALLALIVGLALILWINAPSDLGNSNDRQVKAFSRTTEGVEATCGAPDRKWSDHGELGGTLTYAYDKKGALVHFMLIGDKPPIAVTVSRGKQTYKLDSPEAYNFLPCAGR